MIKTEYLINKLKEFGCTYISFNFDWVPLHYQKEFEKLWGNIERLNIADFFQQNYDLTTAHLNSQLSNNQGTISIVKLYVPTKIEHELSFYLTEKEIVLFVRELTSSSDVLLAELFELAPVAMMAYDFENDKIVINEIFTRQIGYTNNDLVSMERWLSLAFPDESYRKSVYDNWAEGIVKVQTGQDSFVPVDVKINCQDGTTKYFDVSFKLLKRFTILSFIDVTERVISKIDLEENQYIFTSITERIGEILWITDSTNSKMLFVNKNFRDILSVYNRDFLTIQDFYSIIHQEDLPLFLSAQQKYLENTANSINTTIRIQLPNNSCRWFDVIKFALYNENAQVYKHIGIAKDVTSKKEEELRYERLNQLQSTLAKLSITFINKPYQDFQTELVNILETVGKSTQTSKAFIYTYEENRNKLVKSHEWLCSGTPLSNKDPLFEISIEEVEPVFKNLLDNGLLYINHIDELKSYPRIFDGLTTESVGSVIVIPFFERDKVIGLLGLMTTNHQRIFEKDEIELLKVVAELIQNVTLRYKIENSLRESEQEFRKIFENMSEGLVYQDREGAIIRANPSASKIFGVDISKTDGRAQLLGNAQFFDENSNLISTDSLPVYKALKAGKPIIGEVIGFKTESFHTMKWVRVNAIPEFNDEESEPCRIFCTFVDITEQKQVFDSLLESESKYKRLTENIIDVISRLELTPQKHFSYISPSLKDVVGYAPEEFYNDFELAHRIIFDEDKNSFQELVNSNNFFESPIVMRWVKKSGETIWIEQRNVPILNASGELVAIEGISRDITNAKETFDNLSYLSQLQDILMRTFLRYINISPSEADSNINTVLQEIGLFINVEHFFIGKYVSKHSFEIKNEWIKPNTDSNKIIHLQDDLTYTEMYLHLQQNRLYNLHANNINLKITPILSSNECIGFVGIEINSQIQRVDKYDEQILKMTAEMLTNIFERQNFVAEITETQQLFENIIDNNGSIIYVKDLQGIYTVVNATWEKVLGIKKELALGKSDFDLFHEDFAKTFVSNDHQAQNTEAPIFIEEGLLINNEWKNFISVKFPVRNASNQLIGVAGMSTDITNIRLAEKALKESEANLIAILDSSSESIWSVNDRFEIIYANKVVRKDYLESFGVDLVKGINILDALPNEIKKEWQSRYKQVLENRVLHFNDRLPTLNKIFYLEVSMNPILLDNQVVGVSVFSKNITKEKYANNEVLKYSNIFENLLNEIYLFDTNTLRFIGANKAAQDNIGYASEELAYLTPIDIKPLINQRQFQELIAPLINGQKKKLIFETIHQRKNQTQYPVEVHLQIIEIEQEKLFVAIVVDITERKNASIALVESENRFRSIFQSSASIMYIINPDNGQFVDVNEACISFYGWTRRDFSSLNILNINTSEEDVTKKFELISKNSRQVFETKHRNKAGVVFDMEVYSCMIEVGSQNLIFEIAHDVTDRNRYFKAVEVQNKTLKDIAWMQSHVVRAPLSRLMGLVLLLKEGIEDIEMRSQCLEHIIASAFEIDQIIKEITNKTYSVKKLEMNVNQSITTKNRTIHVSIVDDDSAIQLLHKLLIEKAGLSYSPNQFLNGLGMLDYITSHDTPMDVHIIFLDINMPEMNGWDFLESLNKRYFSSTIKVIMVSSSIDTNDYTRAWTYPSVIEFFSKPLDLQKLNNLKNHDKLKDCYSSEK